MRDASCKITNLYVHVTTGFLVIRLLVAILLKVSDNIIQYLNAPSICMIIVNVCDSMFMYTILQLRKMFLINLAIHHLVDLMPFVEKGMVLVLVHV